MHLISNRIFTARSGKLPSNFYYTSHLSFPQECWFGCSLFLQLIVLHLSCCFCFQFRINECEFARGVVADATAVHFTINLIMIIIFITELQSDNEYLMHQRIILHFISVLNFWFCEEFFMSSKRKKKINA